MSATLFQRINHKNCFQIQKINNFFRQDYFLRFIENMYIFLWRVYQCTNAKKVESLVFLNKKENNRPILLRLPLHSLHLVSMWKTTTTKPSQFPFNALPVSGEIHCKGELGGRVSHGCFQYLGYNFGIRGAKCIFSQITGIRISLKHATKCLFFIMVQIVPRILSDHQRKWEKHLLLLFFVWF